MHLQRIRRQITAMVSTATLLIGPVAPALADRAASVRPTDELIAHNTITEASSIYCLALPLVSSDPTERRNRERMIVRLIELGKQPNEALRQCMLLSSEDLVVLLANERMLQPAAGLSQTSTAYIIGGLIVAGIVVLAVAGNSSGSVHVGGGAGM